MSRSPLQRGAPDPHAAQLSALLSGEDPDAAAAVAASAARHVERARRARQAAPHALQTLFEQSPLPSTASPGGARTYEHAGPTRSLVLNAFLHEIGQPGLVPANCSVFNEQTLAPRLLECTRRYWSHVMVSAGDVDAALRLEAEIPPIVNERAARFHLRRALQVRDELGDIARDYEEHRSRLPDLAGDDRRAGCILAAFAGRLVVLVEQRLGPYILDDVRWALGRLLTEGPPGRRSRNP
jgi:hypothetical protein